MSKRTLLGGITVTVAAITLFSMLTVTAGAQSPTARAPGDFPVQYSVKFVCGFMPATGEPSQEHVKPGNYATAINVHNPAQQFVDLQYRIALAYPAGTVGGGALPPVAPLRVFRAYGLRTAEIDCGIIWSTMGVPPGTFLKGMIHVGSPVFLPMAAVYTSQTDINAAVPGPTGDAGISIDVEQIIPFVNSAPA